MTARPDYYADTYDSHEYPLPSLAHPECCDAMMAEMRRLKLAVDRWQAWGRQLREHALELGLRADQDECGLTTCKHCRSAGETRRGGR